MMNPYFIALAESFSSDGIEVNSKEGHIPALKGALDYTDKPTLVLIAIDYEENLKLTWYLGEKSRSRIQMTSWPCCRNDSGYGIRRNEQT